MPAELAGLIESEIGRIEQAEPIAATGSDGASFDVTAGGQRLHAKQVSADAPRLLSVRQEYELLRRLADEDLAPAPLACDEEGRMLVCRHLGGYAPIPESSLRHPSGIRAVAAVLQRLHRLDLPVPPHAATAIAGRYLDSIDADEGLTGPERALADEFLALADFLDTWETQRVPCHGDLIAANILVRLPAGAEVRGMRLVDFEYAQAAPAAFDLAMLVVLNGYSNRQEAALIDCYTGAGPKPFSPRDFAKVRRLVALMAHFWARIQPSAASAASRYLLNRSAREN